MIWEDDDYIFHRSSGVGLRLTFPNKIILLESKRKVNLLGKVIKVISIIYIKQTKDHPLIIPSY